MQQVISNQYIHNIVLSVIVIIVTFILSLFIKKSIDLIYIGVNKRAVSDYFKAKTKTIRAVLKNIIEAILFLLALLIILSAWGVNITPFLTGAGILGLAFSLGSQSIVKDLISGFFIIVDGQFNIGDHVTIATFEGDVYRVTLRTTILKDKKGNLVYVPNSQITTIVRVMTPAKEKIIKEALANEEDDEVKEIKEHKKIINKI
jgi:moderate conductance mechanosensitive channel